MNTTKIHSLSIPSSVSRAISTLHSSGFEAFIVGGCVRDLLMNRKPKDWDITTNASPDDILSLFKKARYENQFGTVAVINEDSNSDKVDETTRIIEITPYRIDGEYSDKRHPDSVIFTRNLTEDLERRDFTINAIAYNTVNSEVIDPFGGILDLSHETIRTVGHAPNRLNEDALRMLRAVRFHVELGFIIDSETEKAIIDQSHNLAQISKERIRDEFIKIVMSEKPMLGLQMCRKLMLIEYIIPELEQTVGVEQNKAHSYDVWNHILKTLQHSADKNYPLHVRLAALLHDISKPESRRWDSEQKQWTFYGHEVIGSRVTERIMERLKFSRETTEKVVRLVRWHMFFSDTEKITPSAARRLIVNVGKENVSDLMNVRICDRIGTGRPKENPYRLRKYKAMLDEVMEDPVSLNMLKINGKIIMDITGLRSGQEIGLILYALFDEVLENPNLNNEKYLKQRSVLLSKMSTEDLRDLGNKGKKMMNFEENKRVRKIRGKHHVD
jgi:tRNA nucleotidyltransferase (CCA-adding enzyme)